MTAQHPRRPNPILLPGQGVAAGGPVDLTTMYVIHHALRRDLRDFTAAARRTPVEDRQVWQALQAQWQIFAEAHHHHRGGEDRGLWPALRTLIEPADLWVLDSMEADHVEIDELLTKCGAGFARLASHQDDDSRAALAVRLCAARQRLGEHLVHKETYAITLVHKHLSDAERRWIEDEHFRRSMRLTQAVHFVPWAVHRLPREVRDPLLRTSGVMVRLMWLASHRSFDRHHRTAFRYVTG